MSTIQGTYKSRVRVIIQARMTSTRLPGKATRRIRGFPMVALAALRVAERDLDVVVATSTEATDDEIVSLLSSYSVRVCRGSLNNVMSRFNEASLDMGEDDVLVRLTADNVFPDGHLIGELVRLLQGSSSPYVSFGRSGGLPHGLAAEAFTVKALRDAFNNCPTSSDIEHVTPSIATLAGAWNAVPSQWSSQVGVRLGCSVDTEEDLWRVRSVFERVSDPLNASWQELVQLLPPGVAHDDWHNLAKN